jgi:signal transduction histidine kinase
LGDAGRERSSTRWLVVAAAALIAGFLGSVVVVDHTLGRLDEQVESIAVNSTPSILELSAARTDLRRYELGVARCLDGACDRQVLADWRLLVDRRLAAYERAPFYPGEREQYARLLEDRGRLYALVDRELAQLAAGDVAGARTLHFGDLARASDEIDARAERIVSINADNARRSAEEMRSTRRFASRLDAFFDGVTVLLGLALLALAVRAERLYAGLSRARGAALVERIADLDGFASRVAHDLRGPLGTILVSAGLARTIPEKRDAALERIERAVRHMRELVDALLDFARAGAPRDPVDAARVGPVLDEVVAQLRPAAEGAGAALDVEPPPPGTVATCSPGVLSSVLANLLENAVKFIADAPGERRIRVRCSATEKQVLLEVEDTGPGLPPGLEERAFEAFVRGGAGTGFGLGLATVKRLVEAHGGRVAVRSAPGEGARFRVELPRGADRA